MPKTYFINILYMRMPHRPLTNFFIISDYWHRGPHRYRSYYVVCIAYGMLIMSRRPYLLYSYRSVIQTSHPIIRYIYLIYYELCIKRRISQIKSIHFGHLYLYLYGSSAPTLSLSLLIISAYDLRILTSYSQDITRALILYFSV